MSRPFILNSLVIRRAPGFDDRMDLGDSFRKDVTLVYGPNGSGKSTIARAVQALLWPGQTGARDWTVAGDWSRNGERWLLEVDAGRVRCQEDGKDANHPVQAPNAHRDRYLLGLEELLAAEDQDLAATIQKEAAGGFDLARAAEAADCQAPSLRRGALFRQLVDDQAKLQQAKKAQAGLAEQEFRIGRIEDELENIRNAHAEIFSLEQALKVKEAMTEEASTLEQLKTFPDSLSVFREEDSDNLQELATDIQDQQRRQQEALRMDEEARKRMEETGLPREGLPEGRLASFVEELQLIEGLQQDRLRLERESLGARREAESLRSKLPEELTPERLESLQGVDVDEMASWVRLCRSLQDNIQSCELQMERLEDKGPETSRDVLRQGLELLALWLGEPQGDAGGKTLGGTLLTVLGGLLAGAGLALGFLLSSLWLFVACLGAALMAAGLWFARTRTTDAPNARAQREKDYKRLNLPEPAEWSLEKVQIRIAQLVDELTRAAYLEEAKRLHSELEHQRNAAELELAAHEDRRSGWASAFGLDASVSWESLLLSMHALMNWRKAWTELLKVEKELEACTDQFDQALARLKKELSPYGYSPTDLDSARQGLHSLEERAQKLREAYTVHSLQEKVLREAKERLARLQERRGGLYERLGLALGDEAGFWSLRERLPDFKEARRRHEEARLKLDTAGVLLEDESLLDSPPEELATRLQELKTLVERKDELHAEKVKIETEMDRAGRSRDLEQALENKRRSREQLRDERDANMRRQAGKLLVDYLESNHRLTGLPRVFQRASQLFAAVTHGEYELDFDPSGPSFRAKNTKNGRGCALDELSSGTRLQLILAVRLAFLDTHEQGLRLPLLLDETLANSDEMRAETVIRTLLDICAAGRQLIYFTAQLDEVAKWRRMIQEHGDVEAGEIDLAQVRGMPETERMSLLFGLETTSRMPPPEPLPKETHTQYGERLEVPGLDLQRPLESAHIWHFFDSAALVHRLLRLGVSEWGPLENLRRSGGLTSFAEEREELELAGAKARMLQAVKDAWSVGRGRPVSREDLEEAGVTESFIKDVNELSEKLGGDSKRLLEALENKEVPRFRQATIDSMREHFLQTGHLDEAWPLDREAMLDSVRAGVVEDLERGLLDWGEVEATVEGVLEASRELLKAP